MKILNRFSSSLLLTIIAGLAGCNHADDPLEGCFVVSRDVGELELHFDANTLTMLGHRSYVREGRTSLFFEYPDWQAFERERRVFGLQGWTHYKEYTQAPTFTEDSIFDQQGRIRSSVHKHSDVDIFHVTRDDFDTWDDEGRPLRAFRTISKDYSSPALGENLEVTCEAVAVEFEYDEEKVAIVTRERSGVDPRDGSRCGGEQTQRFVYGEFPFWLKKIETWEEIVVDVNTVAPSMVVSRDDKLRSIQFVCPPQ